MDWKEFFKVNVHKIIMTFLMIMLPFLSSFIFYIDRQRIRVIEIILKPLDIFFKLMPESNNLILSITYFMISLLIAIALYYSFICVIYYFSIKLKNKLTKFITMYLSVIILIFVLLMPIGPSRFPPINLEADEPEPPIPNPSYMITFSRSSMISNGGSQPLKISLYNPLKEEIELQPTLSCSKNNVVKIEVKQYKEQNNVTSFVITPDLSRLESGTYVCSVTAKIGLKKQSNDFLIIIK